MFVTNTHKQNCRYPDIHTGIRICVCAGLGVCNVFWHLLLFWYIFVSFCDCISTERIEISNHLLNHLAKQPALQPIASDCSNQKKKADVGSVEAILSPLDVTPDVIKGTSAANARSSRWRWERPDCCTLNMLLHITVKISKSLELLCKLSRLATPSNQKDRWFVNYYSYR